MQHFSKYESCVHNLFETQAKKTPNSTAILYKNNKLTYKELDDLSSAFCDYLSENGFGYGSLIGIFVGDYILTVVAMLGILKSGAAYIPLDTGYPVKKIADIIEDSNTSAIITEERLIGLLPSAAQVILIDKVSLKLKDKANNMRLKIYSEESTIYVLFTSGSTGRPKGVRLVHNAIVNLLNWYIVECNITATSRILIISSFSFDLTQKNILGGLLAGATVYFVDINPFTPFEIAEKIFLHKITMINCTPSAFYALSDNAIDKLVSLKMVVLGGEAINTKKLLYFITAYSEVTILNTYGPTECSDIVCCHKITEKEIREDKIIPLGKPIQNTGLLILDDNLDECGVNIIGEGYIIGVGVGIEYINNPILTAERFLQNPFCCADSNNKVMYKTGDLLKKLPNGLYQYVGRNDDQVKVHGCRVELEEIEFHLERGDNIKQAVVVADKRNDINTSLIAYIILYNKDKGIDEEVLRASLKDYLGLYMTPAFFIIMDEFPLTQNKKIDKKLLATRGFYYKRIHKSNSINGDAVETVLSQMWSESLNIPAEKISLLDNFFDLGGYSLLAIKIIGRIEQIFGKRLSILQLIENPTIKKLAVLVKQEVPDHKPILLVNSLFGEERFVLSESQKRIWYLCRLFPDSPFYNLPLLFTLQGIIDVTVLKLSLFDLMKKQQLLRMRLIDSYEPTQEIIESDIEHLPFKYLFSTSNICYNNDIVMKMIEEDINKPIRINEFPLWKVFLFKLDEENYLLYANFHHILFDAWSLDIFKEELSYFYHQRILGKQINPEEDHGYKKFIFWELNNLESIPNTNDNLISKFVGEQNIRLPFSKKREKIQDFSGKQLSFYLSKTEVEKIKKISAEGGVSIFVVLLSIFNVLLYKIGGNNAQTILSPFSNRLFTDIEKTIGCFINLLPVKTDIGLNEKFHDVLIKNKNTIITLLEHQYIPYEKIIEGIDVERDLSKNPVSQILFSLQEVSSDLFSMEKVVAKQVEAPIKFTRFDIEWQNWLIGEYIEIKLIFNKNILYEDSVNNMFSCFLELLDKVADNIDLNIRELLVWGFDSLGRNSTTDDSDSNCIFEMIAEKFIELPYKCAVIDNDICYSYADLDKKIDILVSCLEEKGVMCNETVAVIMPASIYLVVSVLSLLKTKICFVLIDSSFPVKRINNIISSSKAKFILSNSDINCDFYHNNNQVIFVDEILRAYGSNNKITLNNKVKPQVLADSHPAYICYTTGSSGFPKGVIISRSALNNVVKEISSEVDFSCDDSLLSITCISFDIFLLELLMPIYSGGTVVFLDNNLKHNHRAISNYIEKNNITFMQGTPSFFHMLFADHWQCPKKLTLLCGGEEIKEKLAKEILEQGHSLWNMYGPTETTIWASIRNLKKTDIEITIGKPIKNIVFYVLDERKNLLPKGNIGELYIAGLGLANGYLSENRDMACGFSYIDVLDDGNKVRVYRTGDYARQDKNGEYIYCGRVDSNIKINGYRINIEEIEKAALEHACVEQAVVASPLSENGELSLYIKTDKNFEVKEINYSDYLSTLKTLFNEVYDISRNIDDKYLGWIDSVLQKKIPSVEMDEWLHFLIEDIMKLTPKNVLEIGCGSGLLLQNISSSISKYHAVDISEQAIKRAIKNNILLSNKNGKINFYCGSTEDFLCGCKEKFDTIIMISVVQYFPSIFYLIDIIKNTIKRMVPYGKIYIGDIRNIISLPLQNAKNVLLRVEEKDIFDNRELIIHPAFFYALKKFIPEITCVVVKPKLGVHKNELNRFRYDVILTVKGDKKENGSNKPIVYDWMSFKWTAEQVVQLLSQEEMHSVWIKNIRNQRTTYDDELGLDAHELFYEIKRNINCQIELRIRPDVKYDCFDLLFSPVKLNSDCFEFFNSLPVDERVDNLYTLEVYATKPYLRSIIEPTIKKHLVELLPYYMNPKKIFFVKEFLLNNNGKIDKKNIKEHINFKLSESNKIKTINDNENIVVKIWEGLLDKVPACNGDDFFYCGGHSLLAIKLLNEIESCIGISIPLFKFYESPTIDNLFYLIRETHEKDIGMALKVNAGRNNIFLFPPIDGELRWYNNLITYFRDLYNIFGFQYTTDLYGFSIIEIAKNYAAYIEREFKPVFYLFGWSYGALLAFEVAKHLDSKKTRVILLDPPVNIYNRDKSCTLQDNSSKTSVNSSQIKIIQDFDGLNHRSEDLLTRNDIVKNNLQNMFSYDITGKVDNMILFFPENSDNNIEIAVKEEEKRNFWLKHCCDNNAIFCLNGDHYSILKSKGALLSIYKRFNEIVKEDNVIF